MGDGYYLASPTIAREYEKYVPAGQEIELAIIDAMVHCNDEIVLEKATPVGRVDCLSPSEIIEVKHAPQWKSGLGQLLAYSTYFTCHRPVLHLFITKYNQDALKHAVRVCKKMGVRVQFQVVANNRFQPTQNYCDDLRG